MAEYQNKRVAIIGMGRSGMAAAAALKEVGAQVTLYDRKPASDLSAAVHEARRLGIEARPGTEDITLDGVDVLVPSPGVHASHPALVEAVRRGIEVISEIELAYRLSPAPIIAVTGTNGKTTTTIMIGQMLQAAGFDAIIGGNVAAGDIHLPLTTAARQAKSESVLVAEISTFQLEWIRSFRPKIGALLNIAADHGDRHTRDEYVSLKLRLFANQQPDDFAVLNADDPTVMAHSGGIVSRKVFFSRQIEPDEGAWIKDGDVVVRIGGLQHRICAVQDIPLKGAHNVENVLAAAAAVMAFGADPERAAEAVRRFKPVEHRLEPVANIGGVAYINNSMCTNVAALERSLEAMDQPVVLIAGGKFKGPEEDLRRAGKAMAAGAKSVVVIGDSADALEQAVRMAGLSSVCRADSMDDAVEKAGYLAQPGDVVLLAPAAASFDMFENFEHRGRAFKEAVLKKQRAGGRRPRAG